MTRKLLALILGIFILCLLSFKKESASQMYIEVYDRNINHIANITNVKYNITRRVFDLDTSLFEGICDIDVTDGFLFVLCTNIGEQVYSGFMSSISQNNHHISFKGVDLKSIFDTEITLDFTGGGNAPLNLGGLFDIVKVEYISQTQDLQILIPVNIFTPLSENDDILWIANFAGQYMIINVLKFLKPYLAYFTFYIDARFDRVNKTLNYYISRPVNTFSIKLDDFVFDTTRSEISTNKAISIMSFDNIVKDEKTWNVTSEAYYNALPTEKQFVDPVIQDFIFTWPAEDPNDFVLGDGYKVRVRREGNPNIIDDHYFYVTQKYMPRPNLPYTVYYLGKDNQIYLDSIPANLMIVPIKTKIFENEYLEQAQAEAISELVNSRYNENIILTNTNSPIDLRELNLYDFVKIYDDNGFYKEMPVSEIEMSNNLYRVKLGFKKTLFTEVIKR